jgi:peptide/nickel transport system substrate-binding protein
MQPPPEGAWGLPETTLRTFPGYGPDVEKNRAEARDIMKSLGYGPDKPLVMKVASRDIEIYRDPAVILIDQIKQIGIQAELEVVDTALWYRKLARGDYAVGLNLTGNAVDDPDSNFVENYSCKSERNYTQYCNPEVDRLLALQSKESDKQKRKEIVWQVEKLLVDDAARPIIDHNINATCWHPYVKGWMVKDNAIYNNTRFEDLWLDK